jgi:hypothetical protein
MGSGCTLLEPCGGARLRSLWHLDNMLRVVPAWSAEDQWTGWHDPMPGAEVDGPAAMANARQVLLVLGGRWLRSGGSPRWGGSLLVTVTFVRLLLSTSALQHR